MRKPKAQLARSMMAAAALMLAHSAQSVAQTATVLTLKMEPRDIQFPFFPSDTTSDDNIDAGDNAEAFDAVICRHVLGYDAPYNSSNVEESRIIDMFDLLGLTESLSKTLAPQNGSEEEKSFSKNIHAVCANNVTMRQNVEAQREKELRPYPSHGAAYSALLKSCPFDASMGLTGGAVTETCAAAQKKRTGIDSAIDDIEYKYRQISGLRYAENLAKHYPRGMIFVLELGNAKIAFPPAEKPARAAPALQP